MKYKLLSVQVENLQKQYEESLSKLTSLNAVKNEEFADKKVATASEVNVGMDTSLLGALSIASGDYKDAKKKLENYEIIESNYSDVIDLGSTFEVEMNYGDLVEKEVFTLVEVHNKKDDHSFISIFSPLGEAVTGSKIGDEISYTVEKRKITGRVTDIIKEKQKTL